MVEWMGEIGSWLFVVYFWRQKFFYKISERKKATFFVFRESKLFICLLAKVALIEQHVAHITCLGEARFWRIVACHCEVKRSRGAFSQQFRDCLEAGTTQVAFPLNTGNPPLPTSAEGWLASWSDGGEISRFFLETGFNSSQSITWVFIDLRYIFHNA